MRIRYMLEDGNTVAVTVQEEGLCDFYTSMNMDKLIVIRNENGSFGRVINPRKIILVEPISE